MLQWLAKPHVFVGFMSLGCVGAGLLAVPYMLGISYPNGIATITFMELHGVLSIVFGCAVGSWLLGVWWIQRQRCTCGAMYIHRCESDIKQSEPHK